jgi:hypothetical protein
VSKKVSNLSKRWYLFGAYSSLAGRVVGEVDVVSNSSPLSVITNTFSSSLASSTSTTSSGAVVLPSLSYGSSSANFGVISYSSVSSVTGLVTCGFSPSIISRSSASSY